jgi:hypothetical protein
MKRILAVMVAGVLALTLVGAAAYKATDQYVKTLNLVAADGGSVTGLTKAGYDTIVTNAGKWAQWDGGSTGLTVATGRTSLGLGTADAPTFAGATLTGRGNFNGGVLFNQGTGASHNVFYVGSASSGAVNASFGFMVAGVGSTGQTDGPYLVGRGNGFTGISNQRGNFYMTAGAPSTPSATEGQIVFATGASGSDRLVIKNGGAVNVISSLEMNGTQALDASRNAALATATVGGAKNWGKLASAPTPTGEGDEYYDTATHKKYVWDGSAWKACW